MSRIIILVVCVAVLLFMLYKVFTMIDLRPKCASCTGKGYWEGTRGERHYCEVCDGEGKV